MRKLIPTLFLMIGCLMALYSQERYIIWHEGELDVFLENDAAGLTDAGGTKISNSYLLVSNTPSKIKLSNKGTEAIKIKVLALGSKKESLWQNLAAESITSLQDIVQNEEPSRIFGHDPTVWDQITGFYANAVTEKEQEVKSSIEDQMRRRAQSEQASVKKVEGVTFNSPGWKELNSPQELDISWSTRFPITSVSLNIIGQAEPLFKVDNLGYYRIHYPGLNRSIREKLEPNKRYEISVQVRNEAGEEKVATTRFFIKKSLDFDPSSGKQFALDKFNIKWLSQSQVMEVIFQDSETRDTLYYVDQIDVIENIHKVSNKDATGGTYQIDISDFDAATISKINRGYNYDLAIAIRDARGAKRVFSKRFYCLSTEETILNALNEDRDSYRMLMEFAETVQEVPTTEPSEVMANEAVESTASIPDTSPEMVQEEKAVEEEKVSLPKEDELVEKEKMSLPKEDELVEKQPMSGQEDKPVFFYSFDQPLITDESGNNFNALGSILTTDRKGQANQAYEFDGQQDFIALPTNDQFIFTEETPFSLSFWYKSDQPDASLSQIYQENPKEGSFFLDVKLNNGQLMVWCCAKDVSCETLFGKKPELGSWHHMAVTFDASSQLNLYMDGELIRSRMITLDIEGEQASAILFGKDQAGQNLLTGGMDDIYLYKRALTPEEIAKLAK